MGLKLKTSVQQVDSEEPVEETFIENTEDPFVSDPVPSPTPTATPTATPTPSPTPTTTPTPTPNPTATPTPTPEPTVNPVLKNDTTDEMLALINALRQSRGCADILQHFPTSQVAFDHSKDMIQRSYMSHNTKGSGESAKQRIDNAGITAYGVGEVIYGNTSNPQVAYVWWLNSSIHYSVISSCLYNYIGIGYYAGRWTLDLVLLKSQQFIKLLIISPTLCSTLSLI